MSQNRDILPGETMFEYLKRKKRFLLEKTLNPPKPPSTARQPLQERSLNESIDNDRTKRQEALDRTRRDDSRDFSSSRIKDKQEATTRRNSIIEQPRKPLSRSFIQMISPIRSKSPVLETEKSTGKEVVAGRKEGAPPRKDRENFTRRMLTEKINLMRDTIESQLKAGRSLKEKAHLLFLDLKPFFRHLENCGEANFQRKTQEIKGKVRAIESIFKEFNTESHQTAIDQFYMHFSQYLNELDGQAKAEIEQNRDHLTSEISSTKNREILQLKDDKLKLEKELTLVNKKFSKLERSYEELMDQTELKLNEKQQRYDHKTAHFQSSLAEWQQRSSELSQQVQELTQSCKKYQEQRKQLLSQRQRFEEQCLNTITRVKSEQEQFLLNEIVIIKKEFSADITKMTELYRTKEEDLLRRLKDEQLELQKHKKIIEDLMESHKKLDDALMAVQAQNARVKKQNECLATDMHRINEELYQHWLALKDIRTLSQRLDIFSKFRKIYEELLFNEQLFL